MMQMGKPMMPGMGGMGGPVQGQIMTPEMMQRMAMMKAMQQGGQMQPGMPQGGSIPGHLVQNFTPQYR